MKVAIIAKSEGTYSVQRFVEEVEKRGHEAHVILWDNLLFSHEDIQDASSKKSLSAFSLIIPRSPVDTTASGHKKERRSLLLLIARFCEHHNIAMLNGKFFQNYQHFNKLNQQFYLSLYGFPSIPSVFTHTKTFEEMCSMLGAPFIAKLVDGSHGRDMMKITNREEFEAFKEKREMDGRLFIFQKYYPIEKDYRVLYFRGKIIGTFERYNNKEEWRTNVANQEPRLAVQDPELEALGIAIGNKFGFDLVGIDMLRDSEGNLKVIELNTLPQFNTLERVTLKNVAGAVLDGFLV